jgi:hypothetical protein
MRKRIQRGWIAAIAACLLMFMIQAARAQSAAGREHEWLKQLAGEWEFAGEATIAPGSPPMKSEGNESAKMLGDLWLVGEAQSTFMDMRIRSMITIGYDPEKKKFVGTWIDSTSTYLWHYTGFLDESGKVLTLEAEGPDHRNPGKMAKFRDVFEVKSENEKTLKSMAQDEKGEWVTFVTTTYRRKK